MATHSPEDLSEYSVATAPATAPHRRQALVVVIAMLVAYAAVLPYGSTPLPRLDTFIPTVFAIILVTDLITSALLFAQFAATGLRPLLVLAGGYLFSSLVVAGYVLVFPGAFAPTGLFGASPQSSAWLYLFWRLGFAAAAALYALQRSRADRTAISPAPQRAIVWCAAIVTVLVCALVFAVTAGQGFLLDFLSGPRQLPAARYFTVPILMVTLLALFLLLRTRDKSILDLWLIVAMASWLGEGLVVTFFFQERYSLTFYAIRLVGLPVSKVVLIVLLWETIRTYTNLVIANRELRRERASRLTHAATLMAAISHEVRQPLAAINLLAHAGQKSLGRTAPDVDSSTTMFGEIKEAAGRAIEVFDNFLRLIRGTRKNLSAVDMNAMTLEATRLLQKELDAHNVTIVTELARDPPLVHGHAGQLREVILNLIQNAIEAVTATGGSRVITITTSRPGPGAISISLQDTGPGIDPEYLASIFDPFVTTKVRGRGLGLAICKMIVDQHGGKLSASSGENGGARFEITLPTGLAAPVAAADSREHSDALQAGR